ncbi:hypothetical protein DFJ77DRAFT_367796 [Powellomyces hirtus]|nr:hypothetical protein DFJ77DRAFT_367796 [Powellomyces hirtus]
MAALNKVMLLGILGRDPEWKAFGGESDASSGVWSMSVATNKTYKKESGEDAGVTQWHRIEYRGEKLPGSAKKGAQVLIEGELKYWKDETTGKSGVSIVVPPFSRNVIVTRSPRSGESFEGPRSSEGSSGEDASGI